MLITWPGAEYFTLLFSCLIQLAAMLFVTYTKPFTTRIRNFAIIFNETGLAALYGALFGFMK
jgi:hypothetical protein